MGIAGQVIQLERLTRRIPVDGAVSVSSEWAVPPTYAGGARTAVILAHGAGNDMHAPFLVHLQAGWAQRGLLVVRFNFPYKERGAKAPDRAPLLEATWRAMLQVLRTDPALAPTHLFFAGKSMGGRIASHIAAAGEACAGLVFLGYPLHPARQPEKLRAAHLADIACPMLFIEGTRDPLCDLSLLQQVLQQVKAPVAQHVIEGGDHSFKVPRSLGRSEGEVWDEIVRVSATWMQSTASKPS